MMKLGLKEWVEEFGRYLQAVLPTMKKVGGKYFPNTPLYGRRGGKEIHCIRLDVVMTDSGPIVAEMDFVPSGRGFTVSALDGVEREEFVQSFIDWYRSAKVERVLYAVGEKTICHKEINFFADCVRQQGFDLIAHRLEVGSLEDYDPDDVLVDRLFYRSEINLDVLPRLRRFRVSTRTSFLDSKGWFPLLTTFNDDKNPLGLPSSVVEYFRKALPYSIFLRDCTDPAFKDFIIRNWKSWLIKSTDVEHDLTWGARGVLPGCRETRAKFRKGLENFRRFKNLGENPILQQFHISQDFREVWDAAIRGEYRQATAFVAQDNLSVATGPVYARIGAYILIGGDNKVFVPPYGVVTLRQNQIVHGARDAMFLPFKLV